MGMNWKDSESRVYLLHYRFPQPLPNLQYQYSYKYQKWSQIVNFKSGFTNYKNYQKKNLIKKKIRVYMYSKYVFHLMQ